MTLTDFRHWIQGLSRILGTEFKVFQGLLGTEFKDFHGF